MLRICLLDPGRIDNYGNSSPNLGDLLIRNAVVRELQNIFPSSEIVRFSTHVPLTEEAFYVIRHAALVIVGGTNLLSSNMDIYSQWKITLNDAIRIQKAILLGVGWWQYQPAPNTYTQKLLMAALSGKAIHSVRDSYTLTKLRQAGICNALNTACPTMWPLATFRTEDIPRTKSENVLVMLTDYNQVIELDKKLLELLSHSYEKVFVWPQGSQDRDYIMLMGFPLVMLERSIEALSHFLASKTSCDYIGTRLHGGITCLLAKKRSLIVQVDNRTKEIAHDTGLPTANRSDFAYIRRWIEGPTTTQIHLDISTINRWRQHVKTHGHKYSRWFWKIYDRLLSQ